ncbi:hypothetical protein Godav_002822 [Gossypium davidsonii]|uniref:Uncharacterized protein n=1 Tax=Gossypium davidsonii TaxID=34287 RepID=A0A7J8SYA2_GOSDV|nr:hypothetical protein [Gossypium davidsonii]
MAHILARKGLKRGKSMNLGVYVQNYLVEEKKGSWDVILVQGCMVTAKMEIRYGGLGEGILIDFSRSLLLDLLLFLGNLLRVLLHQSKSGNNLKIWQGSWVAFTIGMFQKTWLDGSYMKVVKIFPLNIFL